MILFLIEYASQAGRKVMVREVAAVASSEGSSELWRRQEALEAAVSSGGVSELWGRQAVHSHIFAEWQCVRQCSYDYNDEICTETYQNDKLAQCRCLANHQAGSGPFECIRNSVLVFTEG